MEFSSCVKKSVDKVVYLGAVHLGDVCRQRQVVAAFDSVDLPAGVAGPVEISVACDEPVLAVVADELKGAVVVSAGGDAGVGDQEGGEFFVFIVEPFEAIHMGMAGEEADDIVLIPVDGIEEFILDGDLFGE